MVYAYKLILFFVCYTPARVIFFKPCATAPTTAAVHRRPFRRENAARTVGPPATRSAAVRGRPAHRRHPVRRHDDHTGRRNRATDSYPTGAVVQGLRPATATTAYRDDTIAVQDHPNGADGTAGQNTSRTVSPCVIHHAKAQTARDFSESCVTGFGGWPRHATNRSRRYIKKKPPAFRFTRFYFVCL